MRAAAKKRGRKKAPRVLSARLNARVTLEREADGSTLACFDDYTVGLGKFSTDTFDRAQALRTRLPLDRLASEPELDLLVRRLARSGLLEFCLGRPSDDGDLVVIEPQMSDYWPRLPKPGAADVIVLSRFAYLRRRRNDLVLESPRAGALLRVSDAKVATCLALLSTPRKVSWLRRQEEFPGTELLALLLDCQMLFKLGPASDSLRPNEGDHDLVLWDFHDLLFHTRSTEGRQANPLGGLYLQTGTIPPLPALRPPWPGKAIDLAEFSAAAAQNASPYARLLAERHSTRDFDDQQPITLAELSCFLHGTARVRAKWNAKLDFGDDGPDIEYTTRPYPSAGSAYELELYLAVANCDGLAVGFYHYDADRHALVPIEVRTVELEAMLGSAQFAMDAAAPPQILITIAARFGRISWKYSSIAYSLILKDVGALIQSLYMMAADMQLAGCAIGTTNIDLFARMTGIEFQIEGPVGQFALGRGRAELPD